LPFPDRFARWLTPEPSARRSSATATTNTRHSGIGLHTPPRCTRGTAGKVRARRVVTLQAAYDANPDRSRASQSPRGSPAPGSTTEWLGPISTSAHAARARGTRDHAAVRTLGADQHAFGIPCKSRGRRSAVFAMVTTANRDYAWAAMQSGTESPAGQVVR
jgi:hypothetical protein